ncbi:hypothetical protein [Candidatus Electronema sp. PJ]|uniref:hypothetical protein n=1 Tax=Candidatus Electronema sp. PJ TaxID=3401572 RepID=UPI003AA83B2E
MFLVAETKFLPRLKLILPHIFCFCGSGKTGKAFSSEGAFCVACVAQGRKNIGAATWFAVFLERLPRRQGTSEHLLHADDHEGDGHQKQGEDGHRQRSQFHQMFLL